VLVTGEALKVRIRGSSILAVRVAGDCDMCGNFLKFSFVRGSLPRVLPREVETQLKLSSNRTVYLQYAVVIKSIQLSPVPGLMDVAEIGCLSCPA